MAPLVLREILGVFDNTLTDDCKYPVQYPKYLQLRTQMILSEKLTTFFQIFVPFLESLSNFKGFEKKDNRHS